MHYKHRKVSLEEDLTSARERLAKMESSLVELREQESISQQQLQDITKKLDVVSERLSRLRTTQQARPGFFGSLLNLTEIPPENQREIRSLEVEASLLNLEKRKYDRLLQNLTHSIKIHQEAVWPQRSRVSGLEKAVARKAREEEKLAELRAAAAGNVEQNRKVGASVKRGIEKQPWCPYCGGPLGENPHADHIYPVSKGGRSVPKNMVYVCSNCNALKRNLTLSGFVKKYKLDRSTIENRLEELGKEY
ncbi:MAG: HNH endonuclease [Thermodesulfobacteriota bacterium]